MCCLVIWGICMCATCVQVRGRALGRHYSYMRVRACARPIAMLCYVIATLMYVHYSTNHYSMHCVDIVNASRKGFSISGAKHESTTAGRFADWISHRISFTESLNYPFPNRPWHKHWRCSGSRLVAWRSTFECIWSPPCFDVFFFFFFFSDDDDKGANFRVFVIFDCHIGHKWSEVDCHPVCTSSTIRIAAETMVYVMPRKWELKFCRLTYFAQGGVSRGSDKVSWVIECFWKCTFSRASHSKKSVQQVFYLTSRSQLQFKNLQRDMMVLVFINCSQSIEAKE